MKRIYITRYLASTLRSIQVDPNEFLSSFAVWKAAGEDGARESKFFGKDAAYIAPEVGGKKYALRHVHLTPVIDRHAQRRWFHLFKKRAEKTSDRALVYVYCPVQDSCLLIAILDEPTAHEVAAMKLRAHREVMEHFAVVADAFLSEAAIIW